MSFLVLEEERTSLEAVLAFLDDCDDGGLALDPSLSDLSVDLGTDFCDSHELKESASVVGATSPTTTSNNSVQLSSPIAAQTANAQIPKRQRCRAAPSVSSSRAQKQIAADLRLEVTHLIARLDQLQKRRAMEPNYATGLRGEHWTNHHVNSSIDRCWSLVNANERSAAYHDAMVELRELHAAETANQQLKLAWKKQIKLVKRLETLINQLASLKSEPLLMQAKSGNPAIATSNKVLIEPGTTFNTTELVTFLETLYDQAASVSAFISMRDTSRVFSGSNVLEDLTRNRTLEFTTNTPVKCNLQELDAHVMNYLLSKGPPRITCTSADQEGGPSTSTIWYEHHYSQKLESQSGAIHLKGVSVARKFDEPHRNVLAFTSRMTLAGTEVTFQLSGWVLMTDRIGSGEGSNQALLQTLHRLSASGSSSSSTVAPEGAAYFQDFVLLTKSDEMRTKLLRVQTSVLEQFGSLEVPSGP